MTSFSINRKKTPFQKHREEEEAKKKRDAEENERLYKEFLESFQGDSTPGSKAFVKGGTINPNERLKTDSEGGNFKDGQSVPKKGSRYVPSFIPPPLSTKGKEPDKKEVEKPREKEKGKTRNIDNFMEELKHEQERREKRNLEREQGRQNDNPAPLGRFDEMPDDFDLSGKVPGSIDDGDPQTTNLYVGNLSPQVDENFLLRTFGRFGPIASVKIMWPRTEEEKRRQRNCGFVAFMNRVDGQDAKDEMQGVVVYDYELKIGWGKSVSLPSQALPVPPPGHMAIRNKEGGTVILSGPAGPVGLPVTSIANQNSELVLTPNIPDIVVVPPLDDHLRLVIDTMSLYVLDGGCTFEQAIMERGRGNQLFDFLFELGSKEHTYYVWRLYSFAQGDTLQRWRTEPFILITGSGRWIPPPLPSFQSPEFERESNATFATGKCRRVELERMLTDPQRDEFEDMLRALTLERSQIKDAMGFALDNADAAGEVVEVLTESLTLKETPIPTKVARLMLVSDILHNSSARVKNASAYRTRFEATLPDIMESFNDLYRSVTGRMTAEALKERVLKVLQVWADWFLFSDAYVNGLRTTFLRSGNAGVIPFHSISGDALETEIERGVDGMAEGGIPDQDAELAMGKGEAMKELLILPLVELERRCKHNGLSLYGGREMMVSRLLNLEESERQKGSEYEGSMSNRGALGKYFQDNGGLNSNNSGPGEISVKVKLDPLLPVSKWTHDDGSDDDDLKGSRGLGLSYSSSESENIDNIFGNVDESEVATTTGIVTHSDNIINEGNRQKFRRLEVAVMEYRESLEEQGIHNVEEIETRVAMHRKQLLSEFGLSETTEDLPTYRRKSQGRKRHHGGQDTSSKRHRSRNESHSPQKKSSRDRRKEIDAKCDQEDRLYEPENARGRDPEKSGCREREDHGKDRSRDRDQDFKRKRK